jgi:hypothetical protein
MKPNEAAAPEVPAAPVPPTQIPGCLPPGMDLDSLLTVPQCAVWHQVPESTLRLRLPLMKGVIHNSREDIRVHPRTYLERTVGD